MGTRTPWGTADHSEKIAKGVMRYNTPSHGGYHLSATLNALVNPAWRKAKGWYEEDQDWAIVVHTFPNHFDLNQQATSKVILKNAYPHEYTLVTGEAVSLEESHKLRVEKAKKDHAKDYVVIAAWGSHAKIPAGMVGVCATIGGVRSGPENWFLVPEGEYDLNATPIGFVIDVKRHKEVPKFA